MGEAFHSELIESEGIAQSDRSRVQFKVIDPSETSIAPSGVIYLNHEDIVYINAINSDEAALREYQDTLIENAGFDATDLSLSFLYKVDSDNAEDQDFETDRSRVRPIRTKKPKPTKGPKPTKAPRTKRPKPTKAPKPTKSPVTVSDSGLNCFTVIGGSAFAPDGFTREEAKCPSGIRTGCSALYTGSVHDYKGNWGVTSVFDKWTPDADQGCTAGYYGNDKEADFQVQARCCEDTDGKLGVAIKKGQTKALTETKFPESNDMCIGMLNDELEKDGTIYTGCAVSADIAMDSSGGTWSGSLDPGFGGVRRRPDGTCKGQSFTDAKYETCTGKDVNAGVDCMDPALVIYLDEEDVVYMNSVMHDREKIHAYKETLIENAGYEFDADIKFEVQADSTADWLKANCGGGYWANWRDTDGWNLQAITTAKCIGSHCWECAIVDADWAVENKKLGVWESVVGCTKNSGGMDFDFGSIVDCNGYIDDQIDECDAKKSYKKNFGTYYDGDLCKAQSSSPEIRAQAVCCTFTGGW